MLLGQPFLLRSRRPSFSFGPARRARLPLSRSRRTIDVVVFNDIHTADLMSGNKRVSVHIYIYLLYINVYEYVRLLSANGGGGGGDHAVAAMTARAFAQRDGRKSLTACGTRGGRRGTGKKGSPPRRHIRVKS